MAQNQLRYSQTPRIIGSASGIDLSSTPKMKNIDTRKNHRHSKEKQQDSIISDDEYSCLPSPSAWICEQLGRDKLTNHFNPFAIASRLNGGNGKNKTKAVGNPNNPLKMWQRQATNEILGYSPFSDREDDMEARHDSEDDESYGAEEKKNTSIFEKRDTTDDKMVSSSRNATSGNAANRMDGSAAAEARVVAPHVDKLSPHSCVELRLQSPSGTVAVLCSVDVLKMRSTFFFDILAEQEKNERQRTASQAQYHQQQQTGNVGMWRTPITIEDSNPHEAAAFVECLHESRSIFKGEWNLAWAKLSVFWRVEEFVVDFAAQIEAHMIRVLRFFRDNHWRLNPDVLVGMRIAVLRKGMAASPSLSLGTVVEKATSTTYSKVRVAFEADVAGSSKSAFTQISSQPSYHHSRSQSFNCPGGGALHSSVTSPGPPPALTLGNNCGGSSGGRQPLSPLLMRTAPTTSPDSVTWTPAHPKIEPVIGDTSEPFWIQECCDGAVWMEPDEWFILEAQKRGVTDTDKKVFWEMVQAIVELPELEAYLTDPAGIRNVYDLSMVLKRKEHRLLWLSDAAEILPKEATAELITSAYVCGPSLNS